jgi:NRPS condensation-like uncharacterized protein
LLGLVSDDLLDPGMVNEIEVEVRIDTRRTLREDEGINLSIVLL